MNQQRNERSERNDYHTPVMVDEVVDLLDVRDGGVYVDGTVGGGGHAEAILEAGGSSTRLLGIDRDPEAIEAASRRLSGYGDRAVLVRGNYSDAAAICRDRDFGPIDGLLVDAGVSSRQLDRPERGFSLREEGPLDMRMGPEAERADRFLDRVTAHRLSKTLREYGDLDDARRAADALLEARRDGRLETTLDLVDVVEDAGIRTRAGVHPATLVFQALRIAVNDELNHLEETVDSVPEIVRPGGRAVFISFHSLEDRIVKHGLRRLATDCICPPGLPVCGCDEVEEVEVLTSSPLSPGDAEIDENPRSRSARLRAARVLDHT